MHRAHSRRNNHFFVPDNTRSASPASCKFSSSPDRRLRLPPAIPDTIPRILCPFFRRTFFRRPPFFYTHLTIPVRSLPPPLPPTVEQGEIELTWTRQFSIFLFPVGAMTFFFGLSTFRSTRPDSSDVKISSGRYRRGISVDANPLLNNYARDSTLANLPLRIVEIEIIQSIKKI